MSNAIPRATIEVLPTRPGFIRTIRVTIPPGAQTDRTRHKHGYVVSVEQRAEVERQVWTNGQVTTTREVYEPFQPIYRAPGLDHSIRNDGETIIAMEKNIPPPGGIFPANDIGAIVAEIAEPQDLSTASPDPGKVQGEMLFARGLIDVPSLKTNVASFLQSIGQVLDAVPDPIGTAWEANEITIGAEISPMGAISLAATAQGGAPGAIIFKFARKPVS